MAQFQEALQIMPNLAVAHNSLANALLDKGRVNEAIAHFQRALESQPGAIVARYGLASALMQSGRADEAIAAHQRVAEATWRDAVKGPAGAARLRQLISSRMSVA